jgi:thiosulfate reductase cytochrome b subunit
MDSAGGIETLRAVHHAAGAVLIAAGLYHVSLVLIAVLAKRDATPLLMVPDAGDYGDAIKTMLYFAGLRRERPVLREPTYFQKLDYWVLVWSLAAMGLTGIARLFPVTAARLLSGDGVAAALEGHSDLAVLVVVWVAVVHVAYRALMPPSTAGRRNVSGDLQDGPGKSSAGSRE